MNGKAAKHIKVKYDFPKILKQKMIALTEFIVWVTVINTYSAFHTDRNITVGSNSRHGIPNKLHLQKPRYEEPDYWREKLHVEAQNCLISIVSNTVTP